ncbi:hypothetical protein B296_00051580 [Ensete ventricosum]|uniref:PH domain-containing protein n=1 Tax=Ensete ventricosum TaxID=4639 RepID=A0A426YB77_ENSVE|nr:hypothetical protein B296_00051580 [Ensete ventricosum]
MGISSEVKVADPRMEGWLYLVRHNRLGLQYSRKRYFVLRGNALDCFKTAPAERREELLCFAGKLDSVLSRMCLEQSEISNREIVDRFTRRGVLQRPKMVVDYMLDCGR